ncbi:Gfo/Idh/MocA family oxidoreductase [Pseudonocardia sp.]|jgi:predicted dehydrogenase|uniref:Gfo/Idh/MocA family protein n=1 Tax=Pseudonocardia sp. TaxID=60912 RepID=UPI0031FD681C
MTVRWGIVGPGRIASKVVRDFPYVPGAEVVAVASRSKERATAFAAEHGIGTAYDSYQAILDDPAVDVLYVATPHPHHRAIALAALRAGKALLVEKAFTVTPEATREVVGLARERGIFVMEAMWTRFQPAVVRMRELIADGAIGDVAAVQVELGAKQNADPSDRYFSVALGGGAVFDLTVYPLSFAQMVLGTPDTVHAHGVVDAGGVDVEESVLLGYPDGRTATTFASMRCQTPGMARVVGTQGWIEVLPRFHHPSAILLQREGHEPETIVRPPLGGGYSHELIEVTECITAGRTESAVMPLADTIAVQDILGAVAEQLGTHPQEGPAEL